MSVGVRFNTIVTLGYTTAEHSGCHPVIPVRLLVLISVVNPPDDFLGGTAVLNRRSEQPVIKTFGDNRAMSGKFLTSVCGVLLGKETQPTVEPEEVLAVGLVNLSVIFTDVFDTLSEVRNAVLGSHTSKMNTQHNRI